MLSHGYRTAVVMARALTAVSPQPLATVGCIEALIRPTSTSTRAKLGRNSSPAALFIRNAAIFDSIGAGRAVQFLIQRAAISSTML